MWLGLNTKKNQNYRKAQTRSNLTTHITGVNGRDSKGRKMGRQNSIGENQNEPKTSGMEGVVHLDREGKSSILLTRGQSWANKGEYRRAGTVLDLLLLAKRTRGGEDTEVTEQLQGEKNQTNIKKG